MPLEDVSNDHKMIDWLRQSGHSHLFDEHPQSTTAGPSSPPLYNQYAPTTSSGSYPPYSTSSLPVFTAGHNISGPQTNTFGQPAPFLHTNIPSTASYGSGAGLSPPPMMLPSYDHQSSPLPFSSSPIHLATSNMNQQQLDADIENIRRDPNTRVVQRPPQEDVVYKQRVFVRYLQPPTPPVGGTIIVREKQPPPPQPDPPIVIKRAPPAPPTPPPVIIRERPPPIPPTEGTTVIDKIVPAGPKPPRQVVIEQYPPLPPKPQDVIIERWLPMSSRQRRILYERLPPSVQQSTKPIIVQYGSPHVRVQREVVVAPGTQLPYQKVASGTDINQILSQLGGNQQVPSTLLPSSLVSYNPYTTIQPNQSMIGQAQPNIVIMQNGQPSTISSSLYGMPLSCVCTPNQIAGLGAYGSGVSTIPAIGQSSGQTTVYNVPENIPIDNILRQLGIDPRSIQRSTGQSFTDPSTAVSHVWNAASHANPLDPNSAVSHVWNAAAHSTDYHRPVSPSVGNAWDRIEHYMHPQANDAVRSVWNHIPHSNSPPPPNYPPPPANYPPSSYPPPNYPPPTNYPPPNYPPPTNYPPNYPTPTNYPPPPPSSYPPPGGQGTSGASVLSRLFGGGR
jgi:hypothetical protein